MAYIDPHIHMVSRTTDDYQRMAQAGCVAITEPAFWAGFDRSSAQGFFDYFRWIQILINANHEITTVAILFRWYIDIYTTANPTAFVHVRP